MVKTVMIISMVKEVTMFLMVETVMTRLLVA